LIDVWVVSRSNTFYLQVMSGMNESLSEQKGKEGGRMKNPLQKMTYTNEEQSPPKINKIALQSHH